MKVKRAKISAGVIPDILIACPIEKA